MTGGFLDWAGRVVMLVLAGMVTLSLIASIAAISSGDVETRSGLETEPRLDEPSAEPTPLPEPRRELDRPQAGPAEEGQMATSPGVAASPEPPDTERWLEAITYALLALAGLAALATLLLWRGLRERRRIADALEDLAARR
jgi:hypothetical protein